MAVQRCSRTVTLVFSCIAVMNDSLADNGLQVNTHQMRRPVSVVTVTHDTFFFIRLLVEKVREFVDREYEIIVVDRGSRDGSCEWLRAQSDVRLLSPPLRSRGHGHGEAAE